MATASVGQDEPGVRRLTLAHVTGTIAPPGATADGEAAMTPDVILALYPWKIGDCFRCAEAELFVTPLGRIDTPSGAQYELNACGGCALAMETERQRHARRRGLRYQPGGLWSL